MAKSKTPPSVEEIQNLALSLPLQPKLELLKLLKIDIDNEQSQLKSQLDLITDTKSKINGEGK